MGTRWCYLNPGAEWRPTHGGESRTKCTRPLFPAKSISCWDNYKQMESLQREIKSNMKGHHTASSVLGKKSTVLQGKKSLTLVRHKLPPQHSGSWNAVLSLLTSTTKGKKKSVHSGYRTQHNHSMLRAIKQPIYYAHSFCKSEIQTNTLGTACLFSLVCGASTWKTQRPCIT